LSLATAVLVFAGCVRHPDYSVAVRNVGKETIDAAHIVYPTSGFRSAGGALRPGTAATHSSVSEPPPDTAIVGWTTADGAVHRVPVDLERYLPGRLPEGATVVFEIGDVESVNVRLKPRLIIVGQPGLPPGLLP
jgi:hypothetical protein